MERRYKNRQTICLIGAVLWMLVIFLFSAHDGDESMQDSNRIGFLIGRLVVEQFDELSESEQLAYAETISYPIRKTAHMTEYGLLALLLFGGCYAPERVRNDREEQETEQLAVPLFMKADEPPNQELSRKFKFYVRRRNFQLAERAAATALLLTSIYAATDELHQRFVGGRSGQLTDVLIDSAGAAIALLVLLGIHAIRLRQMKQKLKYDSKKQSA